MKRIFFGILLCTLFHIQLYGQRDTRYSAVNPAFLLYETSDVYINTLDKYNNGKHIISPLPSQYPWESRLENGMPNVIKDDAGNLAIYLSSFVAFASRPPSKVGAIVYTNNTGYIMDWKRPNAGLYWYNANGATADEKIVATVGSGDGNIFQTTNIVAVDVESLGIYDELGSNDKPIKLIYLPQRESGNKVVSAYQMDRKFDSQGILSGFSGMKLDRLETQINFTFKFINGDTHMNFLQQNGSYYFVSRLNAKRSVLKEGETLPFRRGDPRKRYRRETITNVGSKLQSEDVELHIALDMSTPDWEPYSMQPMRLPGFEEDIWWGLVTTYGTVGVESVQHKQRTELAISNDGMTWKYLKPGVPFLNNGTDPTSDDYGCINIAKPVFNTKFSDDPTDLLYFYAASNLRHVSGRNPGVSVAYGKYGKMAGLQVGSTQKEFNSMILSANQKYMPHFSLKNAFWLGSEFFPYILADITSDPEGKTLTQLNSYVSVRLFAYDAQKPGGKGAFLGGTLGSSEPGTTKVSNNYHAVPFTYLGISGASKHYLLEYFKEYSKAHPREIVSLKEFPEFPVVIEALAKNATFYGVKFNLGETAEGAALNLKAASLYQPNKVWSHKGLKAGSHYTADFSHDKRLPNESFPTNRETGTIAIRATPANGNGTQTLLRMYGANEESDLGVYYDADGSIRYTLKKDGSPYVQMIVTPPDGQSFAGHQVTITVEGVTYAERKYDKSMTEDVDIMRVSCPDLNFVSIAQQPILWDWRHAAGSITESDKANARSFAFVTFSAFVPEMKKITVGAQNQAGDNTFGGTISEVQVAAKLPSGASDFWTSDTSN